MCYHYDRRKRSAREQIKKHEIKKKKRHGGDVTKSYARSKGYERSRMSNFYNNNCTHCRHLNYSTKDKLLVFTINHVFLLILNAVLLSTNVFLMYQYGRKKRKKKRVYDQIAI